MSGGEESLVRGSEPAVEDDEADSITTGNAVAEGLERSLDSASSGNAANCRVAKTKSESVEVDEWLIDGGWIELNLKVPRSSSDSHTLVADGDDEENGICECDLRGEVKYYDFAKGNTVDGVQTHVSSV